MQTLQNISIIILLLLTLTTSTTAIPPQSSTLLASETLRNRGYTLFASSLLSFSNFSGTILAPPDYSFAFANSNFFPNNRPKLLLYHTLKPPQVLNYNQLSTLSQNQELATLYSNTCLFFSKSFANEPIISSTPNKNALVSSVRIKQPDIYVDENIVVHGIDSVLDPMFATKCPDSVSSSFKSVNRTFLDHALRALRRTGYSTVAAAMSVGRSELLGLENVTVFAVSDFDLFTRNGGFRFDFRRHFFRERRRLEDLVDGMVLESLVRNKSVVVESVGSEFYVAGAKVGKSEVYRNRWVVVLSVSESFDDVSDVSAIFPASSGEVPSLSPSSDGVLSGSMSPEKSGPVDAPAPVGGGVGDGLCDMSGAGSVGVEGGDQLCSVEKRRGLLEEVVSSGGDVKVVSSGGDVEVDRAREAGKVKVVERVNIVDDLFFYM